MFRNSEFLNQTSYVGYISEENVFIENMNFNNEIPPDFDETDRAERCKDQAQEKFEDNQF